MQSSLKFNEPQEDIRLNKSRATDETFDGVHFLNFNPLHSCLYLRRVANKSTNKR